MPSTPPDLSPWRRAVVPVALFPLLLAGCSSEEPPTPGDRSRHEKTGREEGAAPSTGRRGTRPGQDPPGAGRCHSQRRPGGVPGGSRPRRRRLRRRPDGVPRQSRPAAAGPLRLLAGADQRRPVRARLLGHGRGDHAARRVRRTAGRDPRPLPLHPPGQGPLRRGVGDRPGVGVAEPAGSAALGPRADHGAHRQPGSRDLRRGQQGVGRRRGPRGRGGGLGGRRGDPVRVGRRGGALRPRRPDLPVGPGQRARIRSAQPRRGVVRGHGPSGRTDGGQHPLRAQPRRARRVPGPAGAGSSGTS